MLFTVPAHASFALSPVGFTRVPRRVRAYRSGVTAESGAQAKEDVAPAFSATPVLGFPGSQVSVGPDGAPDHLVLCPQV